MFLTQERRINFRSKAVATLTDVASQAAVLQTAASFASSNWRRSKSQFPNAGISDLSRQEAGLSANV
jgi:hypothetical protein